MQEESTRPQQPETSTKCIVITGGNSGIGLETARGLYGDGHFVIIGSRNQQKNQEAVLDIQKSRPNSQGKILHSPLDLASQESIDSFVTEVKAHFKHLDMLINNAGLMRS